jgi:hypothetical protein
MLEDNKPENLSAEPSLLWRIFGGGSWAREARVAAARFGAALFSLARDCAMLTSIAATCRRSFSSRASRGLRHGLRAP